MAADGGESEGGYGVPGGGVGRDSLQSEWFRYMRAMTRPGVRGSVSVPVSGDEALAVLAEMRRARGLVERLRFLLGRVGLDEGAFAELRATVDRDGRAAVDVGVIDSNGLEGVLAWLEQLADARR